MKPIPSERRERQARQRNGRLRCLDAARRAVVERGNAYGPPALFFAALARRWTLTLGVEITARQVVICLVDMKIERAIAGRKLDAAIDVAGYAACLFEIDAAGCNR